jgi:hypothetical protein
MVTAELVNSFYAIEGQYFCVTLSWTGPEALARAWAALLERCNLGGEGPSHGV